MEQKQERAELLVWEMQPTGHYTHIDFLYTLQYTDRYTVCIIHYSPVVKPFIPFEALA